MDRTELVENLPTPLGDHGGMMPPRHRLDRLEAATQQEATAEETSLFHRASDVLTAHGLRSAATADRCAL
ncbi:hypothetical protein ACWC9Q_36475 [Streptomyces sp. NPDC001142]